MKYKKIQKVIEKEMKEKDRSWNWLAAKTKRDKISVFKTVRYAKDPSWETVLDILKSLGKKVIIE